MGTHLKRVISAEINQAMSLICFLLFASPAWSQTTFSVSLDPGSPTAIQNPVSGDRVGFPISVLRSYCCSVQSEEANVGAHFRALYSFVLGEGPFSEQGSAQPPVFYRGTHSAPEKARICFQHYSGSLWIGQSPVLGFDNVPTQSVTVRCEETTLFGSYNTIVTELNFLELQNIGSTDISVEITTIDNATSEYVGAPPFVILAGSRRDVDLHSFVAPSSFGMVRLWHTGAPGNLRARISKYKITSSDPLSFKLVESVALESSRRLGGGS